MSAGSREAGVKAVLAAPFMHHVPMDDQLEVIAEAPKTYEEAWRWMKRIPPQSFKKKTALASEGMDHSHVCGKRSQE